MLREQLGAALKESSERGDENTAATIRLVLAAVNERDHCAREHGRKDGIDEDEIRAMIRDMVAQRRQEISRCEENAHVDMAEQEAMEIDVLSRFLPRSMSGEQIDMCVDDAIGDLGVTKLKDCGRVMAVLKERYNGQMDFARAKKRVCQRLD